MLHGKDKSEEFRDFYGQLSCSSMFFHILLSFISYGFILWTGCCKNIIITITIIIIVVLFDFVFLLSLKNSAISPKIVAILFAQI